MAELIGYFSQAVLDVLHLGNIAVGTPIYIGEPNIEHIKNRHPYEYDKYFSDIRNIIAEPDYVGVNPKDGSVCFVREYMIASEFVRVAVRVTANGTYFAKSLHSLSTYNAERYIERGTLKKLDKKQDSGIMKL